MSTYKEICNTLKNLKQQNAILKETIEKYKTGEIETLLNEIIDIIQENEKLEMEINQLYRDTYDKVIQEK